MIDEKTARKRRRELQQEADFYGSMDGASKFVKGDAIAGIIVTVVNILKNICKIIIYNRIPHWNYLKNYFALNLLLYDVHQC